MSEPSISLSWRLKFKYALQTLNEVDNDEDDNDDDGDGNDDINFHFLFSWIKYSIMLNR